MSALHRGHTKYFKSLTCHQKQVPCYSCSKKQYVRVILAQKAIQNFSAQRKRKSSLLRRIPNNLWSAFPCYAHFWASSRGFQRFAPHERHGRPLRRWTRERHIISLFRSPSPGFVPAPVHHDARAQPCVDCIVPLGAPDVPRICVGSLDASRSRGPLGAGPCFLTPFCSCSAAPSRGRRAGSRQNTTRVQPSTPSIFLRGFPRQCRTCAASCSGALFTALLSQFDFNTATCSGASPSSPPDCARTPPTHARTGDRVALGRLRALLRACS